jgi:hypothetical protein
MSTKLALSALDVVKEIQKSVDGVSLPPSEIMPPQKEPVLPHSLFIGTRGYLEKIAYQINATYLSTSYDACAVMIRRLIEILVIEAFEKYGIGSKIKDANGDYLFLRDLVQALLGEPSWNLGRVTKSALPKLKTIGDLSAHSRRYNAQRQYIDDIIQDLRVVSEELLYLSGLR